VTLRTLRRWRDDEGAQGLIFAAFTLFILGVTVAFTANVSQLVTLKMRMQHAADAAALSGASVQAQALSAIAAVNNAMLWAYRAILTIVVAVVTLGILVALNVALPGAFSWAIPLFRKALSVANTWIPRLKQWIRQLSKFEKGIARSVPVLAEAEALRIARRNGSSLAAAVPWPGLGLEEDSQEERFFKKLSGGLFPSWALRRIFPQRAGPGEEASRTETREEIVGRDRKGRLLKRNRTASASERDLGKGAPGSEGAMRRFNRTTEDLARDPLPLPLAWTRGYFERPPLNVCSWLKPEAMKRGLFLHETLLPLPAGSAGILSTAAARPFHPEIASEEIDRSLENLYRVDGWKARLVPVDLDLGQHLEGTPLARHLDGELPEWSQH
jgi:hypothetical protein